MMEDLILLHGWGRSSAAMRPMGELLSTCRRTHVIDLPGFGEEKPPEDVWGVKEYGHHLISYMDREGVQTTDIVGHSFGGKIAVHLAATYPERIKRVILIGASGLPKKKTARQHIIKAVGKATQQVDKLCGTTCYATYFIPRFASKDYLAAGTMKKILVKAVNEYVESDARRVCQPTLLLWGADDRETPPYMGRGYHTLIQKSELLLLPGKGHEPFTGVGAHLCVKYIQQFLGER